MPLYRRGLQGPEMLTFHWRELYVMIPRAGDGDMKAVRADIEAFSANVGGRFGFLSWVKPGAQLPSSATRRGIHEHMSALAPRIRFSAVLIEGTTPMISAFIAVAASLMRLRVFDRYPQAMHQSVSKASEWIANQMGVPKSDVFEALLSIGGALSLPSATDEGALRAGNDDHRISNHRS